jgi:hypothetical protein
MISSTKSSSLWTDPDPTPLGGSAHVQRAGEHRPARPLRHQPSGPVGGPGNGLGVRTALEPP